METQQHGRGDLGIFDDDTLHAERLRLGSLLDYKNAHHARVRLPTKKAVLNVASGPFHLTVWHGPVLWNMKLARGRSHSESRLLLQDGAELAAGFQILSFIGELEEEIAARQVAKLQAELTEQWRTWEQANRYLTQADAREWIAISNQRVSQHFERHPRPHRRDGRATSAYALIDRLTNPQWVDTNRMHHNRNWARRERTRFPDIFESRPELEQGPLTDSQVLIATCGEKNVLGLAAAGTGKTTVVLRSVEYHIRTNALRAEDCLLLSFSRAAVKELKDRFSRVPSLKHCEIKTLHKFVKDGMDTVIDAKQRISELAEDDEKLEDWIGEQFEALLDDPRLNEAIREFLIAYMYPYRTHDEFANLGDYFAYLNHIKLKGLDDKWYKSFGEVFCANFSLLNSLDYRYEEPYPHAPAAMDRVAYRPDFMYPAIPIGKAPGWFEFFGVDETGQTRADIDRDLYVQQMYEKIRLHERYRTPFIYATYGDFRLKSPIIALHDCFVGEWRATLAHIPDTQLKEILKNHGVRYRLATLLREVLAGARAANLDRATLRQRAISLGRRGEVFLAIYERIFEAFNRHLRHYSETDFDGLLTDLADAIDRGIVAPLWKDRRFAFIFVDEYQDVSGAQRNFVRALSTHYKARVIGVGDDCQTIYSFAGADADALREFSASYGDTEVISFDRSFRCTGPILRAALRFAEANPKQLPKAVGPDREPKDPLQPRILIVSGSDDAIETAKVALKQAIECFKCVFPDRVPTILMLARKTTNLPPKDQQDQLRRDYRCSIEFRSVHRAKGLGADVVIVTDLVGGMYGFPDRRETDPLAEIMLDRVSTFPDAEERRLFYVALTRAKEFAFLCTDRHNPSAFVLEIAGYPEVEPIGEAPSLANVYHCPVCEGGVLRPPQPHQKRWACEHWRFCKSYFPTCDQPDCGGPLLPLQDGGHECARCNHRPKICPGCMRGSQILRADRNYGCTRFAGDEKGRCWYRLPSL